MEQFALRIINLGTITKNKDKDGNTVLHNAIVNNMKKITNIIIDKSNEQHFDIDQNNNEGKTPLYYTVLHNMEDVAIKLIDNGANIKKIFDKYDNATFLDQAMYKNMENLTLKILDKLLNGVEENSKNIQNMIDYTDRKGYTILDNAKRFNMQKVVKKLETIFRKN